MKLFSRRERRKRQQKELCERLSRIRDAANAGLDQHRPAVFGIPFDESLSRSRSGRQPCDDTSTVNPSASESSRLCRWAKRSSGTRARCRDSCTSCGEQSGHLIKRASCQLSQSRKPAVDIHAVRIGARPGENLPPASKRCEPISS